MGKKIKRETEIEKEMTFRLLSDIVIFSFVTSDTQYYWVAKNAYIA